MSAAIGMCMWAALFWFCRPRKKYRKVPVRVSGNQYLMEEDAPFAECFDEMPVHSEGDDLDG